MSYVQTRYEHMLMNAADATSTSTDGRKVAITRPFIVRRAAMMIHTAGTTAAIVVTLKKRVTPASDSSGTTIGTLTAPSATSAAGVAVYLDNLSTEISYGDEVYAIVSTASTSTGKIDVTIEVEDLPSNPDWSSSVTEVTA